MGTSSFRSGAGPGTAASSPRRSASRKTRPPEASTNEGRARPLSASRARSASAPSGGTSCTSNRTSSRSRNRSTSKPRSPCTTRCVGSTIKPGSSMLVRKIEPYSTDDRGDVASGRSSSRIASIVSYLWWPSAM